jgi:hypothetical protein
MALSCEQASCACARRLQCRLLPAPSACRAPIATSWADLATGLPWGRYVRLCWRLSERRTADDLEWSCVGVTHQLATFRLNGLGMHACEAASHTFQQISQKADVCPQSVERDPQIGSPLVCGGGVLAGIASYFNPGPVYTPVTDYVTWIETNRQTHGSPDDAWT